ncbi:MAG: Xaa-Pro aminopeptidase [Tissierellia bacterium]|nr:Xaa-Pro aminopeptidase [Tissierellia bacterium]
MNKEFYIKNRLNFVNEMKDNSIAVFFSGTYLRDTCDQYIYPFSVDRNFYYLTGIDREDMILVISKLDNKVSESLYIPTIDELYEKWNALFMRDYEAKDKSGITNVQYLEYFEKDLAKKMFYDMTVENVYIFSHYTDLEEFENLNRRFAKKIRTQFPTINILNSLSIMTKLRNVKTEEEILEIKKAVDLTNDALNFIMKTLKPGIFEYEIKSHYNHQLTMKNSRSRFRSVIAAGSNACILHYNEANYQTKNGDMVLMDLGAMNNWYVSDITRTYPINGKFTNRQKELYNIVLEAQMVAMDEVKIGSTEDIVNEAVKKFYSKALKSIKLIKDDSEVNKYYFHGSGHSIGLDLHDLRMPRKEIVENSVYTVEPGLYIAEEGLGIRIEENVVVTKNGLINLSENIIKTVNDIENYMNQ